MNFVVMRILMPTPVMMGSLTEMFMNAPQTVSHATPQALCLLGSFTKFFVIKKNPQSFFPPSLRSLFRKIIQNKQVARQKK